MTPAYLAPDWRYAGDDWAGSNALKFFVYTVLPSVAEDGTVIGGTVMDLTGFAVAGIISDRCTGRALPAPEGAITGDPTQGMITLSLARNHTQRLLPQSFADWGNPDASLLLVRPQVIDPSGNVITQYVMPLFVF